MIFIYESNLKKPVKDGLWAALKVLERTISIKRINLSAVNEFSIPDGEFVLGWGAFGSQTDSFLQSLKNKKGLCIGGNTHPPDGALKYDVLFYETKWYRPQIDFHPNIIQAFGYNSEIYKNLEVERDVDYLGVGAYAAWKRWERMVQKTGNRRVIGEYQINNLVESEWIWAMLEDGGVLCKDMVDAKTLNMEYNRAKTVYIPASIYGGGERAVLEGRACGCKIEIEPDNPKLKELIDSPLKTHIDYANQLKYGLQNYIPELR